jgi:hypothetical protein
MTDCDAATEAWFAGFQRRSQLPVQPGPRVKVVRLSHRIRSKRELMGVLRKQLDFPGYFGHNWDALHDCLRDLSWLNAVDEVWLVHDGVPFSPDSPQQAVYRELLTSVVSDPPPGLPQVRVVLADGPRQ